MDGNNSITLISCTHFNWTARIQYRKSLSNRNDAIKYATRHGCNLIVQYYRRSGPLFDVMVDPELSCASSVNKAHTETIATEPEPESTGWGMLVLQSMLGLAKRFGPAKDIP